MADTTQRRVMRIIDWLFLVMFAFSVIVQFNDPDPLKWAALYAAATAVCALWLARRLPWWLAAAVAGAALVWAATIAPRVIGQVPFTSMFGAFEMRNIGIEESREMYGLVLIAAWMVVLAVRARRSP